MGPSTKHRGENYSKSIDAPRRTLLSAIVANSRGFYYISTILFLLTVGSLRVFVVQYLDYQERTKVQVVELLQQRNFPIREEERQVIVAAVLNALEPNAIEACSSAARRSSDENSVGQATQIGLSGSGGSRPMACDLQDRAHGAFRLSTQLLSWSESHPDSVESLVGGISSTLKPESRNTPGLDSEWKAQLSEYINRYFVTNRKQGSQIVPCATRGEESTAHERAFGTAGCDAPGVSQFTRLLISSRATPLGKDLGTEAVPVNVDSDSRRVLEEVKTTIQLAYPERILQANDFSFVLESIISAISTELSTQPLSLDRPRLVQAYFLSPDSLMRYWDLSGVSPYVKFRASHLWGATGLIQLPLEYQEKHLGREPDSRTREEHDLLLRRIISEKLSRPYVDLGGYGVVRTLCSPATKAGGELLGVFCTDISLPLRLRGAALQRAGPFSFARSEPFIRFSVIRVPQNALTDPAQCTRVLDEARSADALALQARTAQSIMRESTSEPIGSIPREDLGSAICSLAGQRGGALLNEVTRLDMPSGDANGAFLVPISGAGEVIHDDYIGLLLEPRAPDPPARSLVTTVTGILLLVVLLALRIHVYKQGRLSSREDAMLRDLQSGLIDVSDDWCIEYANDRAEELFNASFPALGSIRDLADRRSLWELVDNRPMWHWTTGDGPDSFRYIAPDDINRHRAAGHSFAYYVRLRRGYYGRSGTIPNRSKPRKRWLRVKGSPIFKAPGSGGTALRTFAVVQGVTSSRNKDLEQAWKRETGCGVEDTAATSSPENHDGVRS